MQVVLLGPPGAGKGTQAKLISESLNIKHISSGDLFRQHLSDNTSLGIQAKGYIEKGLLVPDDLTTHLILNAITQSDNGKGFILDGFPRNLAQAQALDQGLEKTRQDAITIAPCLQVAEHVLMSRLDGRQVCKKCNALYHLLNVPPQIHGLCDSCSSPLHQRQDDTAKTAQQRMLVYKKEMPPLLKHYSTQEKLARIPGEGSINEIHQRLMTVLESQRLRQLPKN